MLSWSTLCYIYEITVLILPHTTYMCSWRHLSRLSGRWAVSITSSPGIWGRWSNVSVLDSHLNPRWQTSSNIQSSAARRSVWLCQCWVMHGSWSRSCDKSWLVSNVCISDPYAWPWGISVREERSLIRPLILIMDVSFLECLHIYGVVFHSRINSSLP